MTTAGFEHRLREAIPDIDPGLFSTIMNAYVESELTTESLLEEISALSGISVASIISRTRRERVCFARHTFTYLASGYLNMAYREIGEILSNRDHSTICSSVGVALSALSVRKSVLGDLIRKVETHIKLKYGL